MREQEARCLEYFADLLHVMTTNRYYERVFHLVVDRLVRLFHCQSCAIVLIDRETEFLRIENYFGLSRTFCKEFRSHFASGAIGEMLWKGQPIVIQNAEQLPGLAKDVQLESPFMSCAIVQLSVHHQTMGYLYLDSTSAETFSDDDLPLLRTFAALAATALYQNRLFEENLHLDRMDHEMEIERYSSFSERLSQHFAHAGETGERLGLLIIDVDNFKNISSTYGADARKRFLHEFGVLVKNSLRPFDLVCRYGPDEVMILFPNSGRKESLRAAEKLCETIRAARFTEHGFTTTVSGGIVVFPEDGGTVDQCILAARQSLFEAQRSGRNRILPHEQVGAHTA